MKYKRLILALGIFLILLVSGGVIYFIGMKHAEQSMNIRRVTPDQLANAMQEDHFYNDYKNSALIISGKINSVNQQNGKLVLGFDVNSNFGAYCVMSGTTQEIKTNQNVSILSVGGSAVRQPNSVLLKNCTKI